MFIGLPVTINQLRFDAKHYRSGFNTSEGRLRRIHALLQRRKGDGRLPISESIESFSSGKPNPSKLLMGVEDMSNGNCKERPLPRFMQGFSYNYSLVTNYMNE